jgi:Ca-activated chloride channel family protein
MIFGHDDLLWLLPVAPIAAAILLWIWQRRLVALRSWASPTLWSRLGLVNHGKRRGVAAALLATSLLGALAALAMPRWGTHAETVQRRGVDLVFVLDSSLSMAARDVHPDRLFVATSMLRRIATELPGSRVGLVQAEGEGLVLTPLTVDVAVLDLLTDPLQPSTLPIPGTRLRPAIEQAEKLFPPGGRRGRSIVILSDGEDHGGGLGALAENLHKRGIHVFALGIGTPQGAPIPVSDEKAKAHYKRDEDGQIVITRLHEEALQALTRETGGAYLRVSSVGADIGPLVRAIHHLATTRQEDQVVEQSAERFQWPLALAVLAAIGLLLLPTLTPPDEVAA